MSIDLARSPRLRRTRHGYCARREHRALGCRRGDFDEALNALVDDVKRDRTIVAAILGGSLSHDKVSAKSDIDLVLATTDERLRQCPGAVKGLITRLLSNSPTRKASRLLKNAPEGIDSAVGAYYDAGMRGDDQQSGHL